PWVVQPLPCSERFSTIDNFSEPAGGPTGAHVSASRRQPIQEFSAVFSLVELAASKKERPRYEPYGIAVSKARLFAQGGRPVIYDYPDARDTLPESHRYRFVPYDPLNGIYFTWERKWRIKTDALPLDPKHTLVIVPTADEAFDIVYEFADVEPDYDVEGSYGPAYVAGSYHVPRWLAVSLDLFGTKFGA
ncbi:MAG: hypothetical protein ACREJ4_12440, partial [Candidatus Methylomirabilaceae bacterium]